MRLQFFHFPKFSITIITIIVTIFWKVFLKHKSSKTSSCVYILTQLKISSYAIENCILIDWRIYLKLSSVSHNEITKRIYQKFQKIWLKSKQSLCKGLTTGQIYIILKNGPGTDRLIDSLLSSFFPFLQSKIGHIF